LEADKFLMVLPHTDLGGAAIMANRLRMTLAEMAVHLPDGSPKCAPASFGCCEGTDPAEMLQIAENMLLEAKHSGRNSVRGAHTS